MFDDDDDFEDVAVLSDAEEEDDYEGAYHFSSAFETPTLKTNKDVEDRKEHQFEVNHEPKEAAAEERVVHKPVGDKAPKLRATNKSQTRRSKESATALEVPEDLRVPDSSVGLLLSVLLPKKLGALLSRPGSPVQVLAALLIVKNVFGGLWRPIRERLKRDDDRSSDESPKSRGSGGGSHNRHKHGSHNETESTSALWDPREERYMDVAEDDELTIYDDYDEEDEEEDFLYMEHRGDQAPAPTKLDGHSTDQKRPAKKKEGKRQPTASVSGGAATSSTAKSGQNKQQQGSTASAASSSRHSLFGVLHNIVSSDRPRLPSARQLSEQVQDLSTRCQQAESTKSAVESAYERASCELQEAQSEVTTLKQTTRYLQAQLRDNEEMLGRMVKAERRKAKDELTKMKEAMVRVVEQEREAMREEFKKQAAELENMLLEKARHEASMRPRGGGSVMDE